MYYVKTVYGPKSYRLPNISEYKTSEEAVTFISTCLEWGIDIISCERIDGAVAKRMLLQDKAEK